jgi:RND family efflux transporter MFP subunit
LTYHLFPEIRVNRALITFSVVLLFAACTKAPAPVAVTAPPVLEFAASDLASAEVRRVSPTLALTGTLRPWRETTVKAKVAGELQELTVREGDAVREGQVIGRIESADYQARLSGLEADIAAANATLAIAERNFAIQESLLAKNFISRNAFDTTLGNRDAALARLEAARAAAQVGRKALADTALVAPITGRVSARIVQPGERLPVDGRVITIADVSQLELAASLAAAEAAQLALGANVTLTVEGMEQTPLTGRIERINPSAALGSRSIEVYARIPNPEFRLRGGLFAQGRVTAGAVSEAVVVPASAVREEASRKVVYVLAGERLSRREVRTGEVQEGWVVIQQGIAAGDQVVRHNLGPMKDNAPARAGTLAAPGTVPPAPTS